MCNSYYYLLLMCERAWVLVSVLFNTELCGCPELPWIRLVRLQLFKRGNKKMKHNKQNVE